MIVDAGHLFTDQKINLTYPSQLLTVLETLKRPLFILFIPSASDESPPDPAVNWRCSKEDAYEVVCREFGKGPTPRYLAVLEVGNKDEWTSPTNILKSRYKITTCPLLLRTQLTTLKPSTETGIQTVQFTQFDDIPHKLRFFKKADISHLPTSHSLYKTEIYESRDKDDGTLWDGWDYRFDIISYQNNRRRKQTIAKERMKMRYLREIEDLREVDMEIMKFMDEGHEVGGFGSGGCGGGGFRYEVPEKGLAPSIIETEGGEHHLNRVETLEEEEGDGEGFVVGKVEVMESDDSEDEKRRRKGKKKWRGDVELESALGEGVEKVDFEKRFEVLD
ncbi:hypothetical protein AOL_s00169g60 [Orbilia oligospora ATCC 24927]|uniref:Uncharacterized protein n=1 Tax=Arthrobotrys oligospora (strain ATCC 24927 / CBS 115.81 / DSM 1491) TaxID=756982 RepID=G1XMK7_ARTOA|nr:hypothetical protein AOL_s00169g60 [Orbilia oligospora ATCC 24927]EGX45454.1 hypothetical protein AOL_s00169g60 [Orbilia oligospora ATCC 24927]